MANPLGIVLQGVQLSSNPINGVRLFDPMPINTPILDNRGMLSNSWQRFFSKISEMQANMLPALPVTEGTQQPLNANLTSIGGLTNATGWLHNDGSGAFAYSIPSKADVGLDNVTNNAQVTSVGATLPLESSGTTTPTISVASGYVIPSTSDVSNWNSKQVVQCFTQTISSSTNATIELGYIDLTTNSSFCCAISLDAQASGYEHSSEYVVSGYKNCTGGAWQLVNPTVVADQNSTPTYGLEMKVDNTTAYFRARELRTLV